MHVHVHVQVHCTCSRYVRRHYSRHHKKFLFRFRSAYMYIQSHPGQFFFEKRESCPGCISLPCFVYHVHVHSRFCFSPVAFSAGELLHCQVTVHVKTSIEARKSVLLKKNRPTCTFRCKYLYAYYSRFSIKNGCYLRDCKFGVLSIYMFIVHVHAQA